MKMIVLVIFLSISIFIYCEIKDKKINFSEKQENSEEVKKIEFLSIHGYTKEKNKIYFAGIQLEGVDSESFEYLGNEYAKDKNHVYAFGDNSFLSTEDVDLKSFKYLGADYSKDKYSVYYGYRKLEKIDPSSFEVLGGFYGKDKNNVYYFDSKINNADPETFKVYTEDRYIKDTIYNAEDKNNYYYQEDIVKNKKK